MRRDRPLLEDGTEAMATPSSAVPSPPEEKASFFSYVREIVLGAATMVQDAPLAVTAEAACLMQEVPVAGLACKTFLAFEQLVDTAKSNKEDLATLRDLCEVVIEGVLEKRSGPPGLLEEGFTKLREHVGRAEDVAKLCNGRARQFFLARKICKDIAAVRNDVLAFCAANNLVLANGIHVSSQTLLSRADCSSGRVTWRDRRSRLQQYVIHAGTKSAG